MNVRQGINLRVYGILFSEDKKQVLFIDETVNGKRLFKFPGGGVEPKEGPGPALIREFQEEMNVQIELGELFYVSPNFHLSFFRPQQLLSLYWQVKVKAGTPTSQIPNLHLVWKKIEDIKLELMTHPVDQEVVTQLLARCGGK